MFQGTSASPKGCVSAPQGDKRLVPECHQLWQSTLFIPGDIFFPSKPLSIAEVVRGQVCYHKRKGRPFEAHGSQLMKLMKFSSVGFQSDPSPW